jgi:hypothetical protein
MKPNRGFAKDIYEILLAEGPLAYNGIHKRLRQRNIRASAKQVKKALTNMQARKQLRRAEHCKNKFVVASAVMRQTDALSAEPVDLHQPVNKTPERAQIEPHEALSNAGWREVALVAAIAAISAALTTIILEYL